MDGAFRESMRGTADPVVALIYADWLDDQQRDREAARWRDGFCVGNRRAIRNGGVGGGGNSGNGSSGSGSSGGSGGGSCGGDFSGGGFGGGNTGRGSFGGGSFDGGDAYLYEEEVPVLSIGDQVLVALAAGDRPFVFAGKVAELYGGYGFALWPASMLPWAGENGEWLEIAHGDLQMRAGMRVRPAHLPIKCGCNLSWATGWEGDLPLSRQN